MPSKYGRVCRVPVPDRLNEVNFRCPIVKGSGGGQPNRDESGQEENAQVVAIPPRSSGQRNGATWMMLRPVG